MFTVNAVVVLLVLVHTTASTPSWRLNLSRRQRLRAVAGALAFSKVNETSDLKSEDYEESYGGSEK